MRSAQSFSHAFVILAINRDYIRLPSRLSFLYTQQFLISHCAIENEDITQKEYSTI